MLDLGKSFQLHCLLAERSISTWPKQSLSGERSSEENLLWENRGPYRNILFIFHAAFSKWKPFLF